MGPYLWTDGLAGRRDGLTWACEDVLEDGMHVAERCPQSVPPALGLLQDGSDSQDLVRARCLTHRLPGP